MNRPRQMMTGLLVLCAAAAGVSMLAGTCGTSFWEVTQLSVPRLIVGMLAGASLSMAGASFQALFRNPLASPYTLGISSGASLGAAVAVLCNLPGLWFGVPVITLAAFAGALGSVVIVYVVASTTRVRSSATLLLAGITIGLVCSALIVIALFLANRHDLTVIVRWMMGSLDTARMDVVYEALAVLAPAVAVVIYLHRDLDLLMMSEATAAGFGVNIRRSQRWIFFAGSLLTAGIVAHCGPIGFVGLLIPHIARFLVGPSHHRLLPACALIGAAFLPLCDTIARNAIWWLREDSRQVPVGAITNLIGGGFFLYLLCTRHRQRALF